ncbi:hypothetical protein Tco_0832083 [Tanacetum coccineum]
MDSFQGLTTKCPSSWHRPLLQVQIFYDHVNPVTRRAIDQSAGGKLRDRNAKESWALLEDLALYDNKSWNDPRDFAKPVKEISSPQDVLMVLTTLSIEWKIPNKPLLNMHPCVPMKREDARLSKFESDFKQQQSEMTNKIDTVLKVITDQIAGALPSHMVKNPKLSASLKQSDSYDEKAKENKEEEKNIPENIHVNPSIPLDSSVAFITEKVLKFNSFFESLRLVPQSSDIEVVCTKGDDVEVMFIKLIRKNDDSSEEEPEEEGSTTTEGVGAEYFDIFPTRSELAYYKYLMCSPIPLIFLKNPIITEGCPSNLKIPCNIGHVHVEKAYIDPNSPLNTFLGSFNPLNHAFMPKIDYRPTPTSLKIMFSTAGDGITSSTRRRHNPPRDGVIIFHDGISPHDPT